MDGPTPPVLRVVAAVLVDGPHVLVGRRRAGLREGGRWEFPGGKIEPGESPRDALRREILEELGVIPEIGRWIARGIVPGDERTVHLDGYWARLPERQDVTSTDHDRLVWMHRSELRSVEWPPADLPIRDAVADGAVPRFSAPGSPPGSG